jgi:16S rRNA (guanine527-N7)-methyltransferase
MVETPDRNRFATGDSMDDPRLNRYLELLLEKNAAINLTAAKTIEELRTRHLEDSLQLLALPEVQEAKTALDLGTGGGLPGIPLAIARPELRVTLVDATQKKVRAVQEFIEQLGLTNAVAVAGRAEEMAHEVAWRQRFDLVVARAFAPLPSLLEYAAPFCRMGGHLVAFQGPDVLASVASAKGAMKTLGVRLDRILPYDLADHRFHLVVFDVDGRMPKAYPRGQGLVRKKPLA